MPAAVDSVQGVHATPSGNPPIAPSAIPPSAGRSTAAAPATTPAPAPAPSGPTLEELEQRWEELQAQIEQANRSRDESIEESTVSTLLAMTFENIEMLEEGREPIDEFDQKSSTPKMPMSQIMRMNASGAIRDLIARGDQATSLRAEQIQIEWQINEIKANSGQPAT